MVFFHEFVSVGSQFLDNGVADINCREATFGAWLLKEVRPFMDSWSEGG